MIKIGDKVKYLGIYDAIVVDIYPADGRHEVIDLYRVKVDEFSFDKIAYPNDIKKKED